MAQPPPFLDGTFEWNGLGYGLATASPPLPDPLSPQLNDEWLILASTLELAKQGNWRGLPRLADTMRKSSNALVWRGCADLLGHAGTTTLIKGILHQHKQELGPEGSILFQEHIAYTLHETCSLWAVPLILDLYLQSPDRAEARIMVLLLSHLLEPELGPIAQAEAPDQEYRQLVMQRADDLSARYGGPTATVLYGQLASARYLAETLYAQLSAAKTTWLMYDRKLFEALTGFDCRSFYRERRLQPLAAMGALETVLESSELDRFEPGVRCFFGHRIPA